MPSAIVVTIGSASANSYATLEEAATYFGDRLNASAWDAASGGDDQTKALLMACKRLERENWLGSRVDSTQYLSWPRYGVEKVDSVGGTADFYGYVATYTSTEIPQQVKDAQCELALAYLAGYGQSGGNTVKSFTADGFSVSFSETRSETALPESVSRLLAPLIRGPQLVRA